MDIPDARVAKVRRLRPPGAAAREAGSLLTDFARRRTCSHPLLACACRFPFIPPSLTTPFQTLQPSAAAAGQAPPSPHLLCSPLCFSPHPLPPNFPHPSSSGLSPWSPPTRRRRQGCRQGRVQRAGGRRVSSVRASRAASRCASPAPLLRHIAWRAPEQQSAPRAH